MTDVLHTATAGSLYVEIVFVFDFKLIHSFILDVYYHGDI